MVSFADSERFARLKSQDRDILSSLAKLHEFSAGEVALSSDGPQHWLMLLVTGRIDMQIPGPDGPIAVGSLGPGDLLGEMEGSSELPESLKYVARTDTIARVIAKSPLKQELLQHRDLVTQMLFVYCRSISEKLRMVSLAAAKLGSERPTPDTSTLRSSLDARPCNLTEREVAWIEMMGTAEDFAEGVAVIREGDESREFYVIDSGIFEVQKNIAGSDEPQTLAYLKPGDIFGHMAFVDGQRRSASVVTTEGAGKCHRIPIAAIDNALEMNFTVAFKFLGSIRKVLGRLFVDTVQRAVSLT